jgi:hypothetical protein
MRSSTRGVSRTRWPHQGVPRKEPGPEPVGEAYFLHVRGFVHLGRFEDAVLSYYTVANNFKDSRRSQMPCSRRALTL